MYYNLKAEIIRKGWTFHYFAELCGLNDAQLSNKINGKTGITLAEAVRMKEILGVDMPIEVLFARS